MTLMQKQDFIGDLLHDPGVVLDHQQGFALGLQASQQRRMIWSRAYCGQSGCGFVEQQQFRAAREAASDGQQFCSP